MNNSFKKVRKFFRSHGRFIAGAVVAVISVSALLLVRLGSVLPARSPLEYNNLQLANGGINRLLQQPLNLPLSVLRQIIFLVSGSNHSLFVGRLANALLGAITIGLFGLLIKFWHGNRTAVLATTLFSCNAWLLHVSRLATTDVLYFWAIPLLLVVQLLMLKFGRRPLVFYSSALVCGLLLYIPGLVWFVALSLYWQRAAIRHGWQHFGLWWQRSLYVLSGLLWLPFLAIRLSQHAQWRLWLGMPSHFDAAQIGRQIAFVPIHLFIRGPNMPQLWLGHAPILDIFSLAITLTGIWFYVSHFKATRSRLLASYNLLGIILIGLGGAVSLSVLVPVLYIFAATGIAYLLHDWLKVFPINPIARQLGIGLIVVAVLVSCSYNLRAYFVAWPHDRSTLVAFRLDH